MATSPVDSQYFYHKKEGQWIVIVFECSFIGDLIRNGVTHEHDILEWTWCKFLENNSSFHR